MWYFKLLSYPALSLPTSHRRKDAFCQLRHQITPRKISVRISIPAKQRWNQARARAGTVCVSGTRVPFSWGVHTPQGLAFVLLIEGDILLHAAGRQGKMKTGRRVRNSHLSRKIPRKCLKMIIIFSISHCTVVSHSSLQGKLETVFVLSGHVPGQRF